MTASIIVNTYNRARSLERLLPSLDQLDGGPFEVVVVNGPSTDDTDAVLSRYGDRITIATCPSANLSRSRNIGIAAAGGDVVVFVDDDALPGERWWLQRLVAAFDGEGAARVGAAGGASIHRDTEWAEFAGGWTSDYGEQIFTDQPLPDERGASRWYRRTVGNNSAFRRSALVAIGGFDERFAYYLDEADVCLRLARAGYQVLYLEDCAVRHYPAASPLGAPFIRNRRLIARSDTYYCLKNGTGSLPARLLRTLGLAPRKHFVRELGELVTRRRIGPREAWRLRAQWLRGLVEGIGLGLVPGRAIRDIPPASALVRFDRRNHEPPLSVCLLSRRLPPDPHAGGVGRYTYDLARGLHELGHRVTIVTESEVAIRREGLGFEVIGVKPAPPPNGLTQTPILAQNLAYAEAVAARVEALTAERGPFDVAHASNWGIDAIGVAQRDAVPLVLMLVTPLECVIAAEGWDVSLDLAANVELDQWLVGRSTRVCAPSAGVLGNYAGRRGWSGGPVHTVPLGIVCQPTVKRKKSRPRRRLLFVGRQERRKGIHVLLEVLPDLLDRHSDWQCDLVGSTSSQAAPGVTFEAQFRERHAGAPWRDRVRFHGVMSDWDVQAFYRDADLFVAPSLYESFGLIYQEAMQYGVPVVGCRVGGVPEVVADGTHGLLVPAGDAAALARALDRLMSDDELRHQMGARAETDVRRDGSHLALAQRMVEQYRAAMRDHVGARAERNASAPRPAPVPVLEAAIAVLEAAPSTPGLGLAFRASAALEHGERAEAAALVAAALGVSAHPDYFALALELALVDDDRARALDVAASGFAASRDDSDTCLAFVAVILNAGHEAPAIEGWDRWRAKRGGSLPARLLGAALTAIRTGRDSTSILLLETCLASSPLHRSLEAQALYHLGSALKRRGRSGEARARFERVLAEGALSLLPQALRAALHFHLGALDLQDQRPAASAEHLQACLALNPAHKRARALLAQAAQASAAA